MRATPFLLAASLALAACYAPVGVAYNPYPQPPPVRAETIPPPPISEEMQIWQPGHWDWDGQGYAWRAGGWVSRAGHGTTWQDGYWTNTSGNWAWVAAHWM